MRHFTRWFPIVLLPLLLLVGNCFGQFEEGRAGGTQPTVIPLSQLPTPTGMGIATYSATAGSTSRKLKNVIWFKINEQATMPNGQPMFFKSAFTATVTFEVTTVDKNNITATQTGKTLTVNFETDPTKTYATKSYWPLNPNDQDGYNSVTVKATALSITGFSNWDIPSITSILSLENQMQVLEYFQNPNFQPPNFAVPGYDAVVHPDILSVSWNFPAGAYNNMCQLEYAYVEDETAAYYTTNGQLDYNRLFLDNSTRVDITTNAYNIPMLYDGAGKLYYRVRPAMRRNTGNVETGNWTTPQVYPQNGPSYPGHEPDLNWQATTSFAEEQKSKTVVQYFDGTLRGRQTVTKDNSTGNTVVAETIYDLQGRPNVQILPTPTLGTAVQFFKDFNRFDGMNSASDNPAHYFDLSVAGTQCSGAPKLQTTQGNGQYYSPNNPWNPSPTNPNSEANAAFIPDAQGYAYTETKLMDDPTGRVEAQGGVGINHQLGSGHETKYFYGKPDQDELDAVFGTEVGYAEHYFKNMVQDANGQMSVSYVDMHGRTVATALAGEAPASGALQPIKNNTIYYPPSAGKLTKNLAEPDNNTIKGHSIESINTLLVPTNTVYSFTYDLKPDVYQKNGCSQSLCFDCKYDLEINIRKEGCDNGSSPTAYTYRYNNLAPAPAGQCGTPMLFVGGNIDGSEQVSVPAERITIDKNLSAGSWIVTKTLTINEAAFQARHDIALGAFLCETEQDITNTIFAASGCNVNTPTATADCNACKALLGTSFNNPGDATSYVQRYRGYMSLPVGATLDATSLGLLQKQYDADVLSCGLTCGTTADPMANPTASIRRQMLRDMVPYSGQFALATEDPAAHPLSAVFNIFGNTTAYNGIQGYSVQTAPHPLYKNPSDDGVTVSTYKDENLVADPTMTPAILASATPNLFTNAFDPNWANQLVAYHPEYKKLQLAEGALKPSFDYAQAFQSCTTYALANSAANNFLHPLASDPYFTYVPADNAKMNGYLNVGNNGITIWSMANAAALCSTDISTPGAQNARAACIQSMPTTAISPLITATADLDNFWETFKGLYLGQRNNLVMTYINTQSSASSSLPPAAMAQLMSEGKGLHFLNNADAASQGGIADIWAAATAAPQPDLTTLTNLGNARASGQNAKVCAALKPLWKSELQQCEAIRALMDQDVRNDNSNNQATVDGILNNITNQMEQVCLLSIDANNPNGATEPSPPNMLLSPTNRADREDRLCQCRHVAHHQRQFPVQPLHHQRAEALWQKCAKCRHL